ncbi:MAG: DoxX family protein [Magnetovibrionaceae bacterium]
MIELYQKTIDRLEQVPLDVSLLLVRVGIGLIFFRSGQTKVEGFSITDSTYFLFEEEYKVPLLPPELAAQMATLAEHVLPVMLILGLGARFGALGLLGMTFVIQTFVYPNLWYDHLFWAGALILVLTKGAGAFSLDHFIAKRRSIVAPA